MTGVLDSPMPSRRAGKLFHTDVKAADVVTSLGGLHSLAKTREQYNADRLQVLPTVVSRQRLRGRHLNVTSYLFTPVSLFCRGQSASSDVGEVILELLVNIVDDALMQFPLVAFQGQQVVSFSINDLPRNLCLRAHGINGDDRAFEGHQLQNLWNRRDFVRFLLASHLRQGQPEVRRPDADRMQGPQAFATIVTPPQRLAIHGQNRLFDSRRLDSLCLQRLEPACKTDLKRGRIKSGEDAPKDVLSRNAVGQIQLLQQEIALKLGQFCNGSRAVRSGQHGHERDDHDADQRMPQIYLRPGILQAFKMLTHRIQTDPHI